MSKVRILREALQQCLTHIEADETIHGRKFGAGNVARKALRLTRQAKLSNTAEFAMLLSLPEIVRHMDTIGLAAYAEHFTFEEIRKHAQAHGLDLDNVNALIDNLEMGP
jgi:hypothetical protein